MKKKYKHLTREDRHSIEVLRREGMSVNEIGRMLGRSGSTISRELRRNEGRRGYRHQQAHEKAMARKEHLREPRRWSEDMEKLVEEKLRDKWSPEQISGWGQRRGTLKISHERIYQHVAQDRREGGSLHWCLRQGHRQRRKRCGGVERRGQIPGRISIEERPAHVERRQEVGHYETDLVSGAGHKGFLVVSVERASGLTHVRLVPDKKAVTVSRAIQNSLKGQRVKSVTVDNGKEFAGHKDIAKGLGAKVYFAHAYCSWERGSSENTNGLLRQYFPKKQDFRKLTQKEVARVEKQLNERPRKMLGWKTPQEAIATPGKIREKFSPPRGRKVSKSHPTSTNHPVALAT